MDGKQLKNSILQWAIQGKLVEQRPEEGSGYDLAKKLLDAKQRLITRGDIQKKTETKPYYTKDELDEFPIPNNWHWAQLSDVSIIQEGAGIRKQQYRNKGTQILCVTNILNGRIDLEKKQLYISTEEYLEKYKHLTLCQGDIVTSCSGGSWGKIAFFNSEKTLMLNTSTLRMRFFNDLADNSYLYYLCQSHFFKHQLEMQLSGMQPNFGYAHYSRIMLPLPPLAEQKRIVAKLEKVLPLVDEYDVAQEQLDKLNKELPEALKKSVLQQAIQGKLVPQNPKDEPAQKLLERIAAARGENSQPKGAKSKKFSPTSRIYCENGTWYEQIDNFAPKDISDEIPFDIPTSWVWCRLDCLGTFIRGNGIKRDETTPTGKPCVRYGEMYTTYKVKFSEVKSFTKKDIFDKCHKIHKNDILMALTGENKWDIALAATYQGDDEVAIGGDLCKFTPIECNPLYLVYLINSPYGIGYKRETSTGDIIVHTSVGKLGNFLVPLPPLAEQKRIVSKLEQLFKVL